QELEQPHIRVEPLLKKLPAVERSARNTIGHRAPDELAKLGHHRADKLAERVALTRKMQIKCPLRKARTTRDVLYTRAVETVRDELGSGGLEETILGVAIRRASHSD